MKLKSGKKTLDALQFLLYSSDAYLLVKGFAYCSIYSCPWN